MSSAYINVAFNNNAMLNSFNPTNFVVDSTTASLNAKANQTNSSINISLSSENITSATVTSNTLSLSYPSITSIMSITPSSASNTSLTLTNLPTSDTYASYSISFLINTATYKQFINSISINGTSYTPISVNGFANISVNSSSVYVLQTFKFCLLILQHRQKYSQMY